MVPADSNHTPRAVRTSSTSSPIAQNSLAWLSGGGGAGRRRVAGRDVVEREEVLRDEEERVPPDFDVEAREDDRDGDDFVVRCDAAGARFVVWRDIYTSTR